MGCLEDCCSAPHRSPSTSDPDAVAQFLSVSPQDSFHVVNCGADGYVTGLVPVADMSMRINGGYFVLRGRR